MPSWKKVALADATNTFTSDQIVDGGTTSRLIINSSTHNASVANEARLQLGFGHSGAPDAVGYIKLTENATNSFDGTITIGVPYNNGSGGSATRDALTIRQTGDTIFAGNIRVGSDLTSITSDTHFAIGDSGDTHFILGEDVNNHARITWDASEDALDFNLKDGGTATVPLILTGTSATFSGEVKSTTNITSNSGGVGKVSLATSGNNAVIDMNNSTPSHVVRIHAGGDTFFNGGNVGIGEASPSYKLDVVGSYSAPSKTAGATALVGISAGASGSELVIGGEQTGGKIWIQNRHKSANGYDFEIAVQPQGGTTSFGGDVSIGMPTAQMSKTFHVQSNTGSAGTPNGIMLTNTVHGSDSQIYMYAENDSGTLSGSVIKYDPDAMYMWLQGSSGKGLYINHSGNTIFSENVHLLDDNSLTLGTNEDAQIWNDGSNTYFRNNVSSQDMIFKVRVGSTDTQVLRLDGATANVEINKHLILSNTYSLQWGDVNARIEGSTANDSINILTGGTSALSINSSQNATFGGNVEIGSGKSIVYSPTVYTGAVQGIKFDDPVVTTDSIIQPVRLASNVGIPIFIGANSYVNTSGSIVRYNTSEESSFIQVDSRGDLYFGTNSSGATATTRMYISPAGNVGVGTGASASYKLDITGPATENGSTLRLNDAIASKNSKHLLIQRASSTASIGIAGSQANDPLWISRSGGYDLMVASGGNIGIGTTSPVAKLVVSDGGNAGIELQPEIVTDTNRITNYDRAASAYMNFRLDALTQQFLISNTEKMRLDSTGLGIGTTNPDATLHLEDGNDTEIRFSFGNSQYMNKLKNEWSAGTASANKMRFHISDGSTTGFNEVLTLTGDQRVGIGNNSPSKTLEVDGSFNLGSNAFINYNATYPYTINVENTAGVGNLTFQAGTGSTGYKSKIELQGGNTATDASITLTTADTARMTILNSGDVQLANNLSLTNSSPVMYMSGSSGDHTRFGWAEGDPDVAYWRFYQNSGLTASITMDAITESTAGGKIEFNSGASEVAIASIDSGGVFLGRDAVGQQTTTELGGYGVLSANGQRYGNYGWLTFNAPTTNFTASSRGWALTNGYQAHSFAILKSSNASTEPYLTTNGELGTGATAPFVIDNGGNATFGGGVSMPTGNVSVGGKLNVSSSVGIGELGLEKTFSIAFANGVANQKAQIQFTKFWGELEISVSGTFSHQNNAGVITKKFGLGVQGGATYADECRYTESLGVTANNFAIGNKVYDTANSRYYIPIVHRVSTGNTCTVRVRCLGGDATMTNFIEDLTVSSVYTTDTTVYDKPEVSFISPIGIDTATPEASLHVHGSTGIRLTDSNQNANEYSEIKYDNAGNTNLHINNDWTNTNALISFELAASAKMVVRGDGNVGIGTTSPDGYKLVIHNSSEDLLRLHNTTDGLDSLISFTNPGGTLGRIQGIDNGGLGFDVGNNAGGINSNAMFIANNAKVGIGTTSPTEKLTIFGGVASPATSGTGANGNLAVESSNGNSLYIGSYYASPYGVWLQASNYADQSLTYPIILNPRGGNIGIGTINPSAALEVRDTTANNGHIGGKINIAGDWNETNIAYGGNRSPGVTIQSIDSTAGNFGTLSFMNASGYTGATIIAKHVLHGAGTGNMDTQLHFGTRGIHNPQSGAHNVSAMVIDEDGLVGIGKDNPTQALDVQGSIISSSVLLAPTYATFIHSFTDDLGTTGHFIPWNSSAETTGNDFSSTSFVVPMNMTLKRLYVRIETISNLGSHTLTASLISKPDGSITNTTVATASKSVNAASSGRSQKFTDSQFSNPPTLSRGQMGSIKLQFGSDIGGSTDFFITSVWEMDNNTI